MIKRFVYSLITGNDNRIFYLIFRPLFLFLSVIYFIAVWIIKFLYKINILKSVKLKSKVISVGNISWGGTGKTAIVYLICKFLEKKGINTAVLIRGYGSDEDKMLSQKLKAIILSGKNRIKNAKEAQDKYKAEVLILDDGFQHWPIRRDLDIVAINATEPFGNRLLIPAGILREPPSSLGRCDIAVLTKVNLVDNKKAISDAENTIRDIAPQAEIFRAEHNPISLTDTASNEGYNIGYVSSKKVCAVSAIGDNDSFFKLLLKLGADITGKFSYPDHHKYTKQDIKNIVDIFKKTDSDLIITTQKDWVRLKRVRPLQSDIQCQGLTLLTLNIVVKIENEEKFFSRISALLNR